MNTAPKKRDITLLQDSLEEMSLWYGHAATKLTQSQADIARLREIIEDNKSLFESEMQNAYSENKRFWLYEINRCEAALKDTQ